MNFEFNALFFCSSANGGPDKRNGAASDCESDDDGEEGDYTVYECPGLAPVRKRKIIDVYSAH